MDPTRPDDHRNIGRQATPSAFAAASRAFAASMRARTAERRRLSEEQAQIRRQAETARAEAQEAQRHLARRIFELQAEERRRISRELHDRVAHSMGVVHQSLELHNALKEIDPAQAEAKLELARKMAKTALEHTRNLSAALRSSDTGNSVELALLNLLRTTVPSGIWYELSVEGDESLVPPHVRDQLFLILREAVRNAVAHSGCDRIAVDLAITPEMVVGSVEDNGRGFDPEEARSGGGLRSMEERTALMGGTFGMSSESSGTRVKVCIPLEGT